MNNIWKRSLSFVLAMVMVFSMLPANAIAAALDDGETTPVVESTETPTPDAPSEGSEDPVEDPVEDPSDPSEEPEAPAEDPVLCALTVGCILDAGHEGECLVEAQCEKDAECILNNGHDGDCVHETAEYDYVAMVGEQGYETLAEAVAVGGEIVLQKDVELTESLVIPAGKTVTLNLNGKTISQSKECTASYEMINNKGNLTITGNGKISFTDTGAGDATFGWGSYTIRNEGTLVVENGTIEHLGQQNTAGVKHMYCAIFQYSGSTTINGGTISTPTYRSVRLWKGDMTIKSGNFEGQVWVQSVDNSAALAISGGTFAPRGVDGSSVFVGNVDNGGNHYDAALAVTGGTFTTKIGANDPSKVTGGITGGTFTEAAMTGTNTGLLAEGFAPVDNGDGTYGVKAASKGSITIGYTSETGVWGEAYNANAEESYIIDLYYNDVKIATSTLAEKHVTGNQPAITWSIPFAGQNNEDWVTVWEEGHPNKNEQPTTVKLVIDGEIVSTNVVQMNGPDSLNPVVWKDLEALQPDVAQTKAGDTVKATFKNFEDAIAAAAADSTITEIVVLCDSALESVKNTKDYYDITGKLVITASKKYTVSGCGFAIRVKGNGASLTINKNVTIEGLDVVANGFATTGENMTIDGTLKALSLKQWTNSGTITITENGKVVLGYGDGQFDMAYGNGTVTITGNGDKTAAQFKAGYSGIRGNGNTLNLKDTYFEAGAWFNVNGSNGTINADKALLKVSGGDGAGSLSIAGSGNVINLTNGAELAVANLTIGADNTVKLGAGSKITTTKIAGTGTIEIDATGMTAGELDAIVGDLSGFTGTVTVTGNDLLKAEIGEDGKIVLAAKPVAKIGDTPYTSLEEAFAAAAEGNTITLLTDATPALTSQRAITKAAVIDLGGKTLTLTEDDLYFGTTTFKNGTIVVDPSVKSSTAVFWMFANQTLTFDNVKIVATGVTGTYLIGLDGNNSDLNLLNGSEIFVDNATALDLDIICVNASTGNDIVIDNSKVNVTNLDGRVFFRGNYTVSGNSDIDLSGITKAGFRIEAGQTLTIADTATVDIVGEPRDGGIHLTDVTATYTKAETATVNATVNAPKVAKIGGVEYTSLAEAAAAAKADDEIVLLANVAEDVTLPAGVIFNGNGKQVRNITAAGEVTFKGYTKATSFNVKNTNTTINIVEGACLEITGTGRLVIGHGCTFNIKGTIENAKTANVADLTPSLIMPGASFTGAGVTFNVTNAYIKVPSSYCSSSKSASGTFDFNVTNSIWESAGKLAFESQSTAATVNFELKDSVLTTGSHLVFGVSKGEVVIDNSNVNVGTGRQLENRITMTIKNGSVVNGAVATSANAINPGTIIVENATYAVTGEFSGANEGTGTIIVKRGATVSAGSITKANIQIDATGMNAGDEIKLTANLSKFAGQLEVINNDKLEAKIVDGKVVLAAKPVAKIGDTPYTSLVEAFKAATEGCTIEILSDVTVDTKWDCRDYAANGSHSQFKESVTIKGNGHTIKFTGTINDNNWNTVFRFEENATVQNLTIDISEATGAQRVISAKKSLTVDGLTIIGSARYGVIFGESSSAADLAAAEIVIKNSTLTGTRRAISDNEGGKDVKSVVITGNTLNANVYVSASEAITFNNNTAKGEVDLRSYAAENVLSVKAEGNTLTEGVKNYIYAKTIDAQEEFATKNPPIKVSTKAELNAALSAAKDGDTIILTADIETNYLQITKAITLDLGDKTLTTTHTHFGITMKNGGSIKNGTLHHKGGVAAIKAWDVKTIEDLDIIVEGYTAGKVIGGIVIQENAAGVDTIKNVTIKGAGLTNGIETYNCGDATENVIGSMENVTIDAKGTGMLISAPCGTATNCDIKGGVNGIEIWIKGTYSASLDLVDSDVKGGVYAHDEFTSNPDAVNNGTLSLTVDGATTGVSKDDITLTIARADKDNVDGILETIITNAQAKVNDTYYATLAEAMAAAKAGDTVTVFAGTYPMPSMKAGITVEGVGKVLLQGTLSGTLDNLTLKNLHIKSGNAQRWAYAKGDLVFENVTFEATSVYALHFDGIAAGTNLTYKDCTIIGWAAMGGSPASCVFEGCTIKGNGTYGVIRTYFDATIKDCTFDVANVNPNDAYEDGIHAVEGAKVTVNNCTNANGTMAEIVNVHAGSIVTVDGVAIQNVAKIGDKYFGTLEAAFAAAENDDTVMLLTDIVIDSETYTIADGKTVTLDMNGKKIAATDGKTNNYEMFYVYGQLNVTGNGIIELTATKNRQWNAMSVIFHNRGGILNIENGTFTHKGGTDMAYVIDNSGNYYGDATTNIKAGTLTSTYTAIRNRMEQNTHGASGKAILNVSGGKIDGTTSAIWAQAASESTTAPATGEINISGGEVGLINTARSAGAVSMTTITGGTVAGFKGEIGELTVKGGSITGNVTILTADGAEAIYIVNADGLYTTAPVVIGNVGYATLADAIKDANAGDIVKVSAGTYPMPSMKAGITIIGEGNVVLEGTLSGTLDNLTLKNLHIKGGNAQRWAYAKGDLVFENVTFEATSVYALHFDGIAAGTNLTYKDCTIIGWAAMGGSPASCVFEGCTFKGNGTYGVIRTYFDATIEDCTFDVANVNTSDVYEDGIHAVDGAKVTVNNCTNVNGTMAEIVNVHATSVVEVDGVAIKNVAKIGDNYYATLAEAMAAAQAGDEVFIYAGTYNQNLNVNKAITVIGQIDEAATVSDETKPGVQFTNLVNINGNVTVGSNAKVKYLNVHNDKTGEYDCALDVNGSNIVLEGVKLTGYNGMRYCYAKGDITIKDSTIDASYFALHFDGSNDGNLVIDNCDITGWVSYGGGIDKVTLKNSNFDAGSYAGQRSYADALVIEGSIFEVGYKLDIAVTGSTVTVTNSKMSDGSSIADVFNDDDACGKNTITINGESLVYVAKIGNVYYTTLEEALANVTDWTTIKLTANATLDYNAREAYGRASTTDIIIDGQGYTLTLNQKDSDWSSIGMANAEGKLTLKNMIIEKTGYGDTTGAWNTHAINFTTPVEMNNVTVNNAIAVGADATLTGVIINEANGFYALWIEANGQTVIVNGGSITATNGGRGIKIADQYVDAPASVTLKVDGTVFNTANKAAVLVSSVAGAEITANNVDISGVAADTDNFAWVDEDWAPYFGKVTVNDAPAAQESADKFHAAIVGAAGNVIGYYADITAAVNACTEPGDYIIEMVTDYAEDVTIAQKEGVNLTIDGAGKNYTGEMKMGAAIVVTVKNVNFVKGNIETTKSSKNKLTVENCNFDGADTIWYAVTMRGGSSVTIKNCTAKHYVYDMLYVPSSVTNVTVKDTQATECRIAVNVAYGSKITLDNVKTSAVEYGIQTHDYGAKTITIRNCDLEGNYSVFVWARDNGKKTTDTFIFEGKNIIRTLPTKYAKLVLNPMDGKVDDAKLITPEVEGLNITTNYAGYKVVYDTAAYKLVKKDYVAQIGETKYESLAEAFQSAKNGDTITVIADHVMDGSKAVTSSIYGYDTLIDVAAKAITLDFAGYTVEVTPECVADNGIAATLESIIFLGNGASLTVKGNGGFKVNKGTTKLYSVIYNSESTLTVESGEFDVAELIQAGSVVYADKKNTTIIKGGVFTLGNVGTFDDTKPWIFNVEDKNSGDFVQITGGYFYMQNPLVNQGTAKDCEIVIPDGKVFKLVTEGEYAGYWTIEKEVAKRVGADGKDIATYGSLADALKEAQNGETVILLTNAAENFLMVTNNVTLDLDGYTLEAVYLAAFNGTHVVDNSTDKTGLLKIAKTNFTVSSDNAQMPVWTGEGYGFATVKHQTTNKTSAEAFDLRFRPSLGTQFNSLFNDGMENNGLHIVVRLSWTHTDGKTRTQEFIYNDDMIATAYTNRKSLTFYLGGVESYADMTAQILVVSDLNVKFGSVKYALGN